MMKYKLALAIIVLSVASTVFGQKQGYKSKFETAQQIRNYFADNIALLDPLEGEYDVEGTGDYITPFVHQNYKPSQFKLFIVSYNNEFKVYIFFDGKLNESNFEIKPIADTNAYWMYFLTTGIRIYLQNNYHFEATFKLDHNSAKKYSGNSNLSPSVKIILHNDCIKVFPTATMYANAIRKAQEETKPTEWTGTGFALTNNYIVTNNHVVDGAKTISIQGINGDFIHKYNAEVVATDKYNDLAIIKVSGVTIPTASIPYAIKTGTSEVGEEVFVLGYPLTSTMGEEIKLTTGVISSKTGFQGDVSIYQISAPIQPGNSGGPLFDSKGNVVGIVSAKHKGAENVGYAIKTSYLKNLMESAVPTNILPHANKMVGQNLSGKVKLAKNYVYYITCLANNVLEHSNSIYEEIIIDESNYNKYLEIAQSGDRVLQFKIGNCFQQGKIVKQDYSQAIKWWTSSAEQGYAKAQYTLGFCYANGFGVSKDNEQAFFWWSKAAEQGDVQAQYGLGLLYESGLGVQKDFAQAKFWFSKAANQGHEGAKNKLK